jgi:hypothetical protein
MKAKVFLIADGESTGLGSKAFLFDFAYVIATKKKVLCERSFLVREIFTNPNIMLAAFFNSDWRSMMGKKVFRNYIPALSNSDMRLYAWSEIIETMREDMRTYGVDVFSAYNLRFDMGAIALTHKQIGTPGKVLEYSPDLLCLWEFACQTVCQQKTYHDIARGYGTETGWVTAANNVRTNAEKVYAFISGNHNFVESHTALHDAQIETEILWALLAKKKPIPYNVLDHMPWRKANRIGIGSSQIDLISGEVV